MLGVSEGLPAHDMRLGHGSEGFWWSHELWERLLALGEESGSWRVSKEYLGEQGTSGNTAGPVRWGRVPRSSCHLWECLAVLGPLLSLPMVAAACDPPESPRPSCT